MRWGFWALGNSSLTYLSLKTLHSRVVASFAGEHYISCSLAGFSGQKRQQWLLFNYVHVWLLGHRCNNTTSSSLIDCSILSINCWHSTAVWHVRVIELDIIRTLCIFLFDSQAKLVYIFTMCACIRGTCTHGKVIGSVNVVVVVVMSTYLSIAISRNLGTWVTRKHLESVELGKKWLHDQYTYISNRGTWSTSIKL